MSELSESTWEKVRALFPPAQHQAVADILLSECGNNLPYLENVDKEGLERYRFGDGSEAINQFPELSENWFLLMPQGTTCDFDPALARSSPQASQATAGLCTAPNGHQRFMQVARYGADIVQFDADMPSIGIDDLQALLGTLDATIAACPDS